MDPFGAVPLENTAIGDASVGPCAAGIKDQALRPDGFNEVDPVGAGEDIVRAWHVRRSEDAGGGEGDHDGECYYSEDELGVHGVGVYDWGVDGDFINVTFKLHSLNLFLLPNAHDT